jgi:hypothetical protein
MPVAGRSSVITWKGGGGDGQWSNPMNWTGQDLPGMADDVLLDNGDLPGSYQVLLPDVKVSVRSITITPAPGNHIELILPASNKETEAFSVTGPGYGITLNSGAVFRNACGIGSGESIQISDSLRINNGGRYIHNTRASHANSILSILSSAPGTEKGVFEFDVPRSSYTLSVSKRTYGTLELNSKAYGQTVNYTCGGSNPLSVRGDLRIGSGVNLSINLSGLNGNIIVDGDCIQDGGSLNLASAAGNSTALRIRGDLMQSPDAIMTATSEANPCVEMSGDHLQRVSAPGLWTHGICFRLNNPFGCQLEAPLSLPCRLELIQGRLISSPEHLLTLTASCTMLADSVLTSTAYVDGPLRKEGLDATPSFLFPVGKNGSLRWMELKQATGNFTVEYRNENPVSVGGTLGGGIDHISKMEYWSVVADAALPARANMELSFASPQSGAVTDPAFLNVTGYQGTEWVNAGHAGVTGNLLNGSVISDPITHFSGTAFTLASTVDLENPLPLTIEQFEGHQKNGYIHFSWTIGSPEAADHFELLEADNGLFRVIAQIPASKNVDYYSWNDVEPLHPGSQSFKLKMTDHDGNIYNGKTITINYSADEDLKLAWIPASPSSAGDRLYVLSVKAENRQYRIIAMNGQELSRGNISWPAGASVLPFSVDMKPGMYLFQVWDTGGKTDRLAFLKY